MTLHI